MKFCLIVFACLLAYKLLLNISALIRLYIYRRKYQKFLEKQNFDFSVHTASLVHLFKQASIKEYAVPYAQPAGAGYVSTGRASIYDNLSSLREDVVTSVIHSFLVAKGTFTHRIFETLSPLYWINCVIFLPRRIYEYLGIDADKLSCRVIQLLYWVLTPLLLTFRDHIYQYISALIS